MTGNIRILSYEVWEKSSKIRFVFQLNFILVWFNVLPNISHYLKCRMRPIKTPKVKPTATEHLLDIVKEFRLEIFSSDGSVLSREIKCCNMTTNMTRRFVEPTDWESSWESSFSMNLWIHDDDSTAISTTKRLLQQTVNWNNAAFMIFYIIVIKTVFALLILNWY